MGNPHRKNVGRGYRQFIGKIQIANKLMKRYFTSNQRNSNLNDKVIHFKISRLSKLKILLESSAERDVGKWDRRPRWRGRGSLGLSGPTPGQPATGPRWPALRTGLAALFPAAENWSQPGGHHQDRGGQLWFCVKPSTVIIRFTFNNKDGLQKHRVGWRRKDNEIYGILPFIN